MDKAANGMDDRKMADRKIKAVDLPDFSVVWLRRGFDGQGDATGLMIAVIIDKSVGDYSDGVKHFKRIN